MTDEERRAVRHFQRYTSEQRADRASSHRLGCRQRLEIGRVFWTHPDVPGTAFDTRKLAGRAGEAARPRVAVDQLSTADVPCYDVGMTNASSIPTEFEAKARSYTAQERHPQGTTVTILVERFWSPNTFVPGDVFQVVGYDNAGFQGILASLVRISDGARFQIGAGWLAAA